MVIRTKCLIKDIVIWKYIIINKFRNGVHYSLSDR